MCISRKIGNMVNNGANIGAKEMESGLIDGGDDGEYSGVGFVVIL